MPRLLNLGARCWRFAFARRFSWLCCVHPTKQALRLLTPSSMAAANTSIAHVQARERWWSGIPSMGWSIVGLAFVAGASGAAFNHLYTGELDKDTRQKYTAIVTFGGVLVVRAVHTIWTTWRSGTQGKPKPKKSSVAVDTRGDEGSASAVKRRRPRRDN